MFPCVPGEKRPLVRRGFHDATANAAQVSEWWSRWPQANIGIPTGAASGVEVVDVDVVVDVEVVLGAVVVVVVPGFGTHPSPSATRAVAAPPTRMSAARG